MKYEFMVIKDGEYVPLSSLTPEEQEKVKNNLTIRFADEIAKEQAKSKTV